MFNRVTIGEAVIPLLSVASTDIYYRAIFHEDPIAAQAKGLDEGEAINLFMRMGFVMAKYAELKDRKRMMELNEDDFLDWLDQFERAEYLNALPDIRATYEGQSVTTSDAKKKDDEPSE